MNYKKIIGIALSIIGALLILYLFFWYEEKPSLAEKKVVPIETTKEITDVVETSKKIDEFILARIPGGDEDFFKREQYMDHTHEEDLTSSDYRNETMQFVYSAFMLKDIDQLTVAFSSDSVHSLQVETDNIMDFPQRLTDFLVLVNRDEKLDKLAYQFELDEYGRESNKGVLTLSYQDGIQIPIEIETQAIGDEEHLAYEVITPLAEIKKLYE